MNNPVYMSFGAGIQSTTLALLTINKDPRLIEVVGDDLPTHFVFADTGDERQATYAHLWQLTIMFNKAGLKLQIVRKNDEQWSLSEHVISRLEAGQGGIDTPPVFVADNTGRAMPVRRGCTKKWKVEPLDRWAKAQFNGGPQVTQWYGMSVDELQRLKVSQEDWRVFRYPLVEMRWSRADCEHYLSTQTYNNGDSVAIVRSSCVFCPFHSFGEWRNVHSNPQDWARAVAFDGALRAHGKVAGLKTDAYVLRQRYPLAEFDPTDQIDLVEWLGMGMDNECDGVCGV